MKVTINGITYEGTEEEIRRIVENPPKSEDNWNYTPYAPGIAPSCPPCPPIVINPVWPNDYPRNWDGTPAVTCCIKL